MRAVEGNGGAFALLNTGTMFLDMNNGGISIASLAG